MRYFDTEVILAALCYAMYQVDSSDVEVLDDLDSRAQLEHLVDAFNGLVKQWGVDEVMLSDIPWYDPELISKYTK